MIKIRPLTMLEVLTLHKVIGKYLPQVQEGDLDVLEYSKQIVNNIIEDKNPDAFVRALGMMAKVNFMTLIKMNEVERTSLFVDCILENRLWLLRQFMERLGYGNSN